METAPHGEYTSAFMVTKTDKATTILKAAGNYGFWIVDLKSFVATVEQILSKSSYEPHNLTYKQLKDMGDQ